MPLNQPKIFISHSWEDKPLVRRFEKELQAAGAEVWVDHEGIRGGDNLPERISEVLEWCNTLVLVWTKAASQSRWVKLEWTNAISLEKAIIPCRVDSVTLPAILANKAYVPFSDVEAGLAQLLHALRLHASVIGNVLHLRSTPAMLSETEVKATLLKYDFYCGENLWIEEWSNPQGNGIENMLELRQNGQVVLDHYTALTWQQSGSPKAMKFGEAEKYIRSLNAKQFAGFDDWRLPTLEEAMSLMKRKKNDDDLHIDSIFKNTQRWIWTADRSDGLSCWIVGYFVGRCYNHSVDDANYVRAVR